MRRPRQALFRLFWLLAAVVAGAPPLLALPQAERVPLPHRESLTLDGASPKPLPAVLLPDEQSAAPNAAQSTESPAVLQRRHLLNVAESYGRRTDIPYVWGGNSIGDPETCQECRACVEGKHRLRVERRSRACEACRQCGVDCSHFVNQIFKKAGMPFPYLATAKMKRLPAEKLRAKYGLIDIGHDLSKARPGDLLVTPRHVILLLAKGEGSTGDFVHVSRSIKHGRIGGVELVRDKDLLRYRGRLVRILRYRSLDEAAPAPAPVPLPPSHPDGQRLVRTP